MKFVLSIFDSKYYLSPSFNLWVKGVRIQVGESSFQQAMSVRLGQLHINVELDIKGYTHVRY